MKKKPTRVGRILELLDPKIKEERETQFREDFIKEIELRRTKIQSLIQENVPVKRS